MSYDRYIPGISLSYDKDGHNPGIYQVYTTKFPSMGVPDAGRLRSAVALELAAGKVWALPKTVQIQLVGSSGATARATLNGLGATARAPVAASHHACGREELLRCWADSETRLQGAGVPSIPSLLKTERRGRGLDPVARDNPADSLMTQGQRCLPYPNRLGRASRLWEVGLCTGPGASL